MLFLYQVENIGLFSSKVYLKILAVICAGKCTLIILTFFSGKPLSIVYAVVNKKASWKAEGKKINVTKSKYGRYLNN